MTPKQNSRIQNYVLVASVMFILVLILVLTARVIFAGLKTADEIDEKLLQSETPRINQIQLDNTFKSIDAKDIPAISVW